MIKSIMTSQTFKRFSRSKLSLFGLFIVSFFVLIGTFGPLLLGEDSLKSNPWLDLAPISKAGLLGKAENGVDLFAALIFGSRISLLVAVISTIISAFLGTLYGSISGYLGGKIDALMMRVVDVLLAFPGLLLAIYIAAVLPPALINIILALIATGWVGYARLVRAQVIEAKKRQYVTAAALLGASHFQIIKKHILPNIIAPIIIQASFGLSVGILAEAALSFLGLGVPPGTPSWGELLDQGVSDGHLLIAPHLSIFPGLCIATAVLAFNFLGDGLRDVFDVRD